MNIVSTGQLRAQSISIQVSDRTKCNGACKFCIARTTPNTNGTDEDLTLCDSYGVGKGVRYASHIGATHGILTGKAEPTQEDGDYLGRLIIDVKRRLPLVDLHTNGYLLQKGKSKFKDLEKFVMCGLTMVTFSIAHYDIDKNKDLMGITIDYPGLIKHANSLGLLVRCSLVLAKSGIGTISDVARYIRTMGELGVHMIVMRELWTPDVYGKVDDEVLNWNKENKVPLFAIENVFRDLAVRREEYTHTLDPLPWGANVYAMEGCFSDKEHGVNITFAKCEENASGPVLKSIVHKPNGHGYRNWDSNANILY